MALFVGEYLGLARDWDTTAQAWGARRAGTDPALTRITSTCRGWFLQAATGRTRRDAVGAGRSPPRDQDPTGLAS